MKILDVELKDIDFSNADDLEKFENATEEAKKKIAVIEANVEGKTASQVIRDGCNVVFDCFNTIFGEGTAKKVFGNVASLKLCLTAFKDLVDERNKQDKELNDTLQGLNGDYNPNRATRRANAKSKKANN